jgi:membrane-associated protease RseP (regulator of RpoE activity)
LERGSIPDGAPGVFHLGDADQLAEISMTIAGRPMSAHIDTGSPGGIMLPLSVASSLPLVSPPVVVGRGKTVNASFDIYSATLDGMAEIGPFRLERPEIHFVEGAPVGNIGNGFLSNYVVTIDPAGRRMRLEESTPGAKGATRARTVKNEGSKRRYGIRFPGIGGDRLEVLGVEAGSPGEKAGIKQGDVIVGMNGKPVSELDQAARIAALRGSPLSLDVVTGDRTWVCTLTLE